MSSIIQKWGSRFCGDYSDFIKEGKGFIGAISSDIPAKVKIKCIPALLASGVQVIGFIPLQPIATIMTIADAVFHYFSANNVDVYKRAEKYELAFRVCRFSVLTLTTGRLFREFQFPLPSAIIQAKFISRAWLLGGLVTCVTPLMIGFILKQINRLGMGVLDQNLKARLHENDLRISCRTFFLARGGSIQQKLQNPNGETISVKRLNHPALWILVSQQIVYTFLSIFSKSHIPFAALSFLNLYTLYKIAYTHWMLVDWQFKRFSMENEIVFRWRATSFIGTKESISTQLKSLLEVIETFELVNPAKSGYICYTEKNLLQELQKSGRVVDSQLSILLEGERVKLISLDYYPGKTILVLLTGFNEKMQMLYGKLPDGTIAYFPNVSPEKARQKERVEVEAQIVSKFTRNNIVHLICSSKELREEERVSMTRLMGHVGVVVKVEGDIFPGKVGVEESFRNFCLVNQITRIPLNINGKEVGAEYKVYAEKDLRPLCDRLLVWVKDEQWEWCLAEIIWLDYQPAQSLQVKIVRFNVEEKTAYGSLPDQTTVYFPKVFSELAQEKQGKVIEAQVISKKVENGFLYLECSSDTLLPKPEKIIIQKEIDQPPLTSRVRFKYNAVLKPTLGEAECDICNESLEVLYSVCSAPHLFCKGCWTQMFQGKIEELKIVNLQPLILGGAINGYRGCIQQEALPNCAICRGAASPEDQLSVHIGDIPLDVTIINYIAEQKIQIIVDRFDFSSFTAMTTLSNGTVVELHGVQPSTAIRLIESEGIITAEILAKTIENGRLYLRCSSTDLPPRIIFIVNQELTFKIERFDNSGLPFGFLPSGEKVFFHIKDVVIGKEVKGYFWAERITEEGIVLDCMPFQKDQIVEVQLMCFDPHYPASIIGRLTNNQKVVFYLTTSQIHRTFTMPSTVMAHIRNLEWRVDGNSYLVCELAP